jgi:hypothetical protein
MPNIHGKSAVIYMSPTGGGVAIPIGEQLSWSIDFDMAIVDTTPLVNSWKQFVKGLQGWTGTFAGNFDIGSKALWTASIDTVPQTLYLYPRFDVPAQFYSGTAWIQLGKIAEGSTTTKASSSFKATGQGALLST